MAIGAALSKQTTYAQIEDKVRLDTDTVSDYRVSPVWFLKEISLSVEKIGGILLSAGHPFYLTTNSTLTISGTANPYTVDLSGLTSFPDRIDRVVHVTTGGVRTFVPKRTQEEAEKILSLSTIYGSSLFHVFEGDALRLYRGSSFTITTATDTVEMKYLRQPIVGSVTRSSNVDIIDKYVPLVVLDVTRNVLKAIGKQDTSLDNELQTNFKNLYEELGISKAEKV